jgi:predicted nucleotidyltransferase
MGTLEDLVARAEADRVVLGVVLTGSHARDMAGPDSDIDVYVVLDRPHERWPTIRSHTLDQAIYTMDALADTAVTWQRYSFRGARVLLDRLGGRVAELVHAQATLTESEAITWAREALDAYINQVYRAAKNRRDGQTALARLDDMESLGSFLTALFAMHGRIRPYNKYLRWELSNYPLDHPWNAPDLPERLADEPSGFFSDLERLARRRGHGDVVDSWGDSLSVIPRRAMEADGHHSGRSAIR